MRPEEDARARVRRKYLEIRRLRAAPPGPRPTDALRALAAEFPGSLRELDAIPLESVERRLAELDAGEPPWLAPLDLFHRRLGAALRIRRWVRARAGAPVVAAFAEAFADDRDALPWADELERLASPPEGRTVALVVERVARELALSPADVRAALGGG